MSVAGVEEENTAIKDRLVGTKSFFTLFLKLAFLKCNIPEKVKVISLLESLNID